MAILTFNNIMEAEDITEKEVLIEEWSGSVIVRSVSYRKINKLKDAISAERGEEVSDDDVDVEKGLLVAGMVNPEITIEEAEMLMDKSASAVMKVLTAIMGQSKVDDKAVKEEEKSLPSGTE